MCDSLRHSWDGSVPRPPSCRWVAA